MTKLQELEKLDGQLCAWRDKKNPSATETRDIEQVLARVEELNAELVSGDVDAAIRGIRAPVGERPHQGHPGSGDMNRELGEYLQAVYCASPGIDAGQKVGRFTTGRVDHATLFASEGRAPSGAAESSPSLGGFAVGADMATEIFTKAYQRSILWQRCRQFPISSNSNSITIPGTDETSRADGSRQGGIRSYWQAEAATKTASTPKFSAVEMSLKKLIGLTYSTDELLQDAALLGEWISSAFEREFAFKLDDAVLRGTGAGQPLGILNGPSLVSVSGASSADTIVSADVLACYARLWPGSEGDSIWIANRDTIPQLMTMNSATDGTGSPFWMPMNSLAGRPYNTLMGRPIFFVEQCSTLGDVGDLVLLDLTQYGAASKGGIQAATSIHVQFLQDETCFRFVMRVDGQPLWASAVTPYQGSDTQSPFVAIGTRT